MVLARHVTDSLKTLTFIHNRKCTILIGLRNTGHLSYHLRLSPSSCKTDTVPVPLPTPLARPPAPGSHPPLSVSVDLAAFGTSYGWNHSHLAFLLASNHTARSSFVHGACGTRPPCSLRPVSFARTHRSPCTHSAAEAHWAASAFWLWGIMCPSWGEPLPRLRWQWHGQLARPHHMLVLWSVF